MITIITLWLITFNQAHNKPTYNNIPLVKEILTVLKWCRQVVEIDWQLPMKRIDEKIGKRTQKTRKERKRLRKQLPRPQLFPIITHPFSIPGPGLSLSLSHISGNCMDTIPVFYLSKSMFMGGGCWSYEVREKEGRVSICVCGGLTPINGFHGLDRVLHSGFIRWIKKIISHGEK